QSFNEQVHSYNAPGRTGLFQHSQRVAITASDLEHSISLPEAGYDPLHSSGQRAVSGTEPEMLILDLEQHLEQSWIIAGHQAGSSSKARTTAMTSDCSASLMSVKN